MPYWREMIQIAITAEEAEGKRERTISNNNRTNKQHQMLKLIRKPHRNNSRSLLMSKYMTMGWTLVLIMEVAMTLTMQASTTLIMRTKMMAMISMMDSMPAVEGAGESL
jgi:hypothetical protein